MFGACFFIHWAFWNMRLNSSIKVGKLFSLSHNANCPSPLASSFSHLFNCCLFSIFLTSSLTLNSSLRNSLSFKLSKISCR